MRIFLVKWQVKLVRSHFLKPDYISGAWILRPHKFKFQKRARNCEVGSFGILLKFLWKSMIRIHEVSPSRNRRRPTWSCCVWSLQEPWTTLRIALKHMRRIERNTAYVVMLYMARRMRQHLQHLSILAANGLKDWFSREVQKVLKGPMLIWNVFASGSIQVPATSQAK